MEISVKINGKDIKADIKPNTLLSTFIREHLNLTGTHIGCDTSMWRMRNTFKWGCC